MDIYQYAIEDLKVARETAGVEQVHINAPTGKPFDICVTNIILSMTHI